MRLSARYELESHSLDRGRTGGGLAHRWLVRHQTHLNMKTILLPLLIGVAIGFFARSFLSTWPGFSTFYSLTANSAISAAAATT